MKKLLCVILSVILLLSSVLSVNMIVYALPSDVNISAQVGELKLAMQTRRNTVTSAYARTYNTADKVEEIDGTEFYKTVFEQAVSQNTSKNETDGDYLRWHYTDYTGDATILKKTVGSKVFETITLSYQINYYTTKEQEDAVTAYVDAFLKDNDMSSKDAYTKVKLIHDFICNTVEYDHATADNTGTADKLSYSAYGAIVNHKAVCQGYSTLFYRLCVEAGLRCRVITGDNHMWNIVILDDNHYYNVDCAWDDITESNDYFLKGESDFPEHERTGECATENFRASYPMGESAYVYEPNTNPDEPATQPSTEPSTQPDITLPDITLPDITLPDITIPSQPSTEPSTEPTTQPVAEPSTAPTAQPTAPPAQSTTQPTTQPATQPVVAEPTAPTTAKPATQAKPAGATKVGGEWVASKQKNTKIKKLTKAKKSFKATWSKVTGVKGYQVQYATDKKFKKNKKTVTISKNKTTSTTVKKLKANKKYFVRIRTYKNVKLNGKTVKVYSKWSSAKTVTTK